ncbi:hypothetical protein [uncultured Maribacter sp.]|uniref:hypothetical protein n=1 Tax=uncultured Maribacter sp. TaxID=431308 RepID=UPI0030ECAEC5|tara:strand:- start:2816 stop:3166 length:351 start_codon:yes stop_codon:yes gene_type:complete
MTELIDEINEKGKGAAINYVLFSFIFLVLFGEILRFIYLPFGFELISIGTGGVVGALFATLNKQITPLNTMLILIVFLWCCFLFYRGFRISSLYYAIPSIILSFIVYSRINGHKSK